MHRENIEKVETFQRNLCRVESPVNPSSIIIESKKSKTGHVGPGNVAKLDYQYLLVFCTAVLVCPQHSVTFCPQFLGTRLA
jgi:hypothetical protein